jgi:hypothetical protein
VYQPTDLNRDWSPRFSTLRDKNAWIGAKTAGNLNLGVSRNRFCDFLADPDSRSFSRFYTNIGRSRYNIQQSAVLDIWSEGVLAAAATARGGRKHRGDKGQRSGGGEEEVRKTHLSFAMPFDNYSK